MHVPLIEKGIVTLQKALIEEQLEGWLFYHFNDVNSYAMKILSLKKGAVSREMFYYIPAYGNPIKIVHDVEETVLNHLSGERRGYRSKEQLLALLREHVGNRKIAMEYSLDLPQLSRVDGGTIDHLRKLGVEIISSAQLIVELFSKLTEQQLKMQKIAVQELEKIQMSVMKFTFQNMKRGLFEKDVQELILEKMDKKNLLTCGLPIVAVGKNSASPHYSIVGKGASLIENSVLMIDAWCKLNEEDSVYADLTKMFYLGREVDDKLSQRYAIVYEAVQQCIQLIHKRINNNEPLKGFEVDQKTLETFKQYNVLKYCIHRTGHCIDQDVHGDFGANFDDLEVRDIRPITHSACYSAEPALYFPDDYGIRLESNIIIDNSGKIEVRGESSPKIIIWTDLSK